jgi:hypothetical protein
LLSLLAGGELLELVDLGRVDLGRAFTITQRAVGLGCSETIIQYCEFFCNSSLQVSPVLVDG